MRRYDRSYAEMKAALTDGVLGRAVMMHNFHRNVETPAHGFTADMAITNSAPHEFDVARFVLETEYAAISAFSPAGAGGKVGPVFMVIETTTGQLVTIEINNNAAYNSYNPFYQTAVALNFTQPLLRGAGDGSPVRRQLLLASAQAQLQQAQVLTQASQTVTNVSNALS